MLSISRDSIPSRLSIEICSMLLVYILGHIIYDITQRIQESFLPNNMTKHAAICRDITCLERSDLATDETIGKARQRQLKKEHNINLDVIQDTKVAGNMIQHIHLEKT